MNKYKRVLIKLSGGAMKGQGDANFDAGALEHIVKQVLSIRDMGVEVVIVTGGGNIFRGNTAEYWGIERAEADNIGMLGTIMNALMLKAALKARSKYEVRVMTAVKMEAIAEPYIRLRAINQLSKGYIVIMAAGIGQPFVTTDYPAAQRAIETRCEAIFVAKEGVDGVYSADPKKDKKAKLYKTLAYDDFIASKLNIMDHSAILLARDHKLPIHIFNFHQTSAMQEICLGNNIGTYISPHTVMQTY